LMNPRTIEVGTIDAKWIALCCFEQTEKDREESRKIYEEAESERIEYELWKYGHMDELWGLAPDDLWKKRHEIECAWQEYLTRTWEH